MGALRGRDRARRGAGALHAAHHLERRQLGLAGLDAGHPRHGARRGAAARLVAGRPPRARGRRWCSAACSRDRPHPYRRCGRARSARYGEHYVLIALTVAASLVGVRDRSARSAGSMLPLVLQRAGLRPRERLGAVRRDARGRDRHRDLLHGREPDPGGARSSNTNEGTLSPRPSRLSRAGAHSPARSRSAARCARGGSTVALALRGPLPGLALARPRAARAESSLG